MEPRDVFLGWKWRYYFIELLGIHRYSYLSKAVACNYVKGASSVGGGGIGDG